MTIAASSPADLHSKLGKPRAAAVVWRPKQGQVEFLIVSCSNNPNRFTLPGGKIDAGETGPQAALRETREEAGVVAFAQRCLGSYLHRKRGQRVCPTRVYLARYQADATPDELRNSRWLTARELSASRLNLRDEAREMIMQSAWHFEQQLRAA
ncbi:MAG: NUDIX domain-containing protein [Phycisphaerales bacterium JB063]